MFFFINIIKHIIQEIIINKNRLIKKAKRDLSAKPREDNFIFTKKIDLKEKTTRITKRKIIHL